MKYQLTIQACHEQRIDAVENGVTLGEIADTMRKVFGLFKESITL